MKRKTHKKQYPAVRLKSATGKMMLASQIRKSEREREKVRNPDASFWADYEPDRRYGTFAVGAHRSYTHNGITKYL